MEQWRLFIAIDLPVHIKQALALAQDQLRQAGLPLGYVRPEAMHLTLVFLGQVGPDRLLQIGEAMQQAAWPCAALRLSRTGAFPSLARPSVLWLGLTGATDDIHRVYVKLQNGLLALGFPQEQRPFTPHLTLARVRHEASTQQRAALGRAIQRVEVESLSWQPSQLTLYRSELLPGGPRYTALNITNLSCGPL